MAIARQLLTGLGLQHQVMSSLN